MQTSLTDLVQNPINFLIIGVGPVSGCLDLCLCLCLCRSEPELITGGVHFAQKVKEAMQIRLGVEDQLEQLEVDLVAGQRQRGLEVCAVQGEKQAASARAKCV